MKKYELTEERKGRCDRTLYRIKALKDFADIKTGDLGGWIEKEDNLNQYGEAWVYEDAEVFGNAEVCDNAKVYGEARVFGSAKVHGCAKVYGNARVFGHACVRSSAEVCGNAKVCGDAEVCDNARAYGNAWVSGTAEVCDNAYICGDAEIHNDEEISGTAKICGNKDYATARGFGSKRRTTTFFRLKDGDVGVQCGCFYGTLDEFREKVKSTYPDDKKGREYLMLADLMEYRFKQE